MTLDAGFKRCFRDVLRGPVIVLVISCSAAIVMGAVWGMVDWLRNYGLGLNPFPYLDHTNVQMQAFRSYPEGTLMGGLEDLIMWYNGAFRGATRFGSGLGLIAGAFTAIGISRAEGRTARLATSLVASVLIGARAGLMFGSAVPVFVVGGTIGALLGLLYGLVDEHQAGVAELPPTNLAEIP